MKSKTNKAVGALSLQSMTRLILVWLILGVAVSAKAEFQAGVAAVDITPPKLPVRVNGMFTERLADRAIDTLHARSVALDDGKTKIVFCVVDTCMMPRELIDEAKKTVEKKTGLSTGRMMVSATHTHSAPAAMSCLGSRMDPDYVKWLPGKLAESMSEALGNLQPARIGWASIDDWEHTHNRRWIFRLDRTLTDPFGDQTMHANMHPGHLSGNVIGPSGPVDPELSLFAVQTKKGKPLALFANYSQHYYGSGLLSADYFGAFCRHVAKRLEQPSSEGPFVAMMSQGTSGDLMWMDYGAERKNWSTNQYAEEVADYAMRAYEQLKWNDHVLLEMVEKKLLLDWRRPDTDRLEWAQARMEALNGELPRSQQDIYAMEAAILHEKPKAELKLQAIRIGGLGIATLPNEVYAITGLKLKAHSPFESHFNIELANGSEGYIPPPEQHPLGGYTTWPARTAGLEIRAEPQIVDKLLLGLEEVAGKKRNPFFVTSAAYKDAGVLAHWPLDDLGGETASPNHGLTHTPLRIVGKVARYLPGVGSGSGSDREEALTASPLAADGEINRSMHLVDGYLETDLDLPAEFTVALWYWLGEHSGASMREGNLIRLPSGQTLTVRQDIDHRCRLFLGDQEGTSHRRADEWNLVVLVQETNRTHVYLNGRTQPGLGIETGNAKPVPVRFGEGLEGKLDEIALWNRALDAADQQSLWRNSGMAERRAKQAATRRRAEQEAEERANPPEWPAEYDAVITDMVPVRHDPLATKPEGMAAEQSVRFSPGARAIFEAGRIRGKAESLGAAYSVSFWFRNDLPNRARPVTAYVFSRGPNANKQAPGDHLGIGGHYGASYPGKLLVFNGNEADEVLIGKTLIPPGTWNHVVFVRDKERARAWLNGKLEIDGKMVPTTSGSKEIYLGARSDFFAPLKGYLAEFALFDRALTARDIRDIHAATQSSEGENSR
ncbi:MAG: LamG-like jellyroll fold domain-containing protein [Verrucomicrobiales bacterium]